MAGSEVPQRMRYQNGNGSSLSFSLGKCNLMGLSFCAVLDPKIHPSHVYTNIGCMVLFKGKSGYSRHEKLYWLYERWDYQMKFQSEHVFLWGSSSFLDSNYSFRKALFQFFVVCYDDDGAGMITNREKIVKCGVHPIFKHKEKKNQDGEEEKQPSPSQRLKESQEKYPDLSLSFFSFSGQTKRNPVILILFLLDIHAGIRLIAAQE